MSASTER